MKKAWSYETVLGAMTLAENGQGGLTDVTVRRELGGQVEWQRTPLLDEAARQMEEYLAGRRKAFDLPLAPVGTPFQQRVWAALRAIPYGETRTYQQIAQAAGSPKGFRAVGMANHANPLLIVVPCHRVIGKDGSLTGFGGGLPLKERLLALEAAHRGGQAPAR